MLLPGGAERRVVEGKHFLLVSVVPAVAIGVVLELCQPGEVLGEKDVLIEQDASLVVQNI